MALTVVGFIGAVWTSIGRLGCGAKNSSIWRLDNSKNQKYFEINKISNNAYILTWNRTLKMVP